jgi:uroporphyrinogen decarboxylase
MKSNLTQFILNSSHRIPLTIGVYAGLEITGASVKDAVSSSRVQTEAVLALHEHLQTEMLLTAMDLSVEAELFGCDIRMSEDEIPTVVGRRVKSTEEIDQLAIPEVGKGRTRVQLATAKNLVDASRLPVLGGVIGPFSLAGRIFGVSEALELSITDPVALENLLEKVTRFSLKYLLAFRETGASGVIMAEPAAGLLSPRGLGQFSSRFIRRLVEEVSTPTFTIVYHNCGAKKAHLEKILETGAAMCHFSTPMAITEALALVNKDLILAGNLDPTAVFHSGTEEQVRTQTSQLLAQTSQNANFVISSGCDIPPKTPLANLKVFYDTVRGFNG